MSDEFLFANPFFSEAIDEEEIWAEVEDDFRDIASINGAAFQKLTADIDFVKRNPQHKTAVRFMVGAAGSGKSHLFSRLRRSIGKKAIFVFASNPPCRPDGILRWLLDRVIFGMKRRHQIDGEVKPYSQLQSLLYRLLHFNLRFPGNLDDFHQAVQGDPEDFFAKCKVYLESLLYTEPDVARGLAQVLHPERSDLAFRWLAGSTSLLDADLEIIAQREPLDDEMGLKLLSRLGRITLPAQMPIVLVLDQLDLIKKEELVNEFERLLFALINNSKNWFIVISLIQNIFELWTNSISGALKSRIVEKQTGRWPVVELELISDPGQKRDLILSRLSSPVLKELRQRHGRDPFYPFKQADIDRLMSSGPIYARDLIKEAGRQYTSLLTGKPVPPTELSPEIEAAFEKTRAEIDEDKLDAKGDILAERLIELIEVVCMAENRRFESRPGPLEARPKFKGTDSLLKINGREIRLLGHHIQQGRQFPDFLKLVSKLPRETVLVRDGAVPVSGPVTMKSLADFQREKTFIHLSRREIADVYALGQVLAKMREGDFQGLSTHPPPTSENVMRCLGQMPRLAQNQVVQTLLNVVNGGRGETGEPIGEAPQPPRPPKTLVDSIRQVMESARWLVLERLRRQLKEKHSLDVTLEQLIGAVASKPLREELLCYPPDIRQQADIRILIWAGESNA